MHLVLSNDCLLSSSTKLIAKLLIFSAGYELLLSNPYKYFTLNPVHFSNYQTLHRRDKRSFL
jgi:hypothetical protein